jgi:CRISPR-associated endonuclease Cas2
LIDMLLALNREPQWPRLTVVAYDIGHPQRARRVRKLLDSLLCAKQYSVYEILVAVGELNGVLAELTEHCNLTKDKVAIWWPRGRVRIELHGAKLTEVQCGPLPTSWPDRLCLDEACGNYVVCYDISDPDALDAVAAEVSAEGTMLQRSVYWLRTPKPRLAALLRRCGRHVAPGDKVWAYPLRGAHELWRVSGERSSVLPIAADRWEMPWR